jgi:hypothetical protein
LVSREALGTRGIDPVELFCSLISLVETPTAENEGPVVLGEGDVDDGEEIPFLSDVPGVTELQAEEAQHPMRQARLDSGFLEEELQENRHVAAVHVALCDESESITVSSLASCIGSRRNQGSSQRPRDLAQHPFERSRARSPGRESLDRLAFEVKLEAAGVPCPRIARRGELRRRLDSGSV